MSSFNNGLFIFEYPTKITIFCQNNRYSTSKWPFLIWEIAAISVYRSFWCLNAYFCQISNFFLDFRIVFKHFTSLTFKVKVLIFFSFVMNFSGASKMARSSSGLVANELRRARRFTYILYRKSICYFIVNHVI